MTKSRKSTNRKGPKQRKENPSVDATRSDLRAKEEHEAGYEDDTALNPDEVLSADLIEADSMEISDGDLVLPSSALNRRPDNIGLTRYDPLQAYMRDVQRYVLLSAEDQQKLAVRFVETGDVDAAAQLVTSNLRLVVKIAYDYRRAYRNLLDLIQEGNIGLMQAVRKYDPYKGVKLSSYAAWWIRAYMLRFILNNWRMVKLGTTQAQRKLFYNLNKERARLTAMGIEPTVEEIAKNLSVNQEEVVNMDRRLTAGEVSLDAPVRESNDGHSMARVDLLPSESLRMDELLAEEEMSGLLHQKIEAFATTLKGKDAIIFQKRVLSEEPKTLQELGQEFGISRERVRQLEQRVQTKLKEYLKAELGQEFFEA